MFCFTCEKECRKTHSQRNLHRIVREMQCRDCSEPLIVGGKKKTIPSSELLYVSMHEMLLAGLPPKKEIAFAAPLPAQCRPRFNSINA